MPVIELLAELNKLGIRLWLEEEQLRFKAPKGALTGELREELVGRKEEIIKFISKTNAQKSINRESITVKSREGNEFPTSYSQQSLWFFEQLMGDNCIYNIPNAIRIQGKIDLDAVKEAIRQLSMRHEILRTTFRNDNGSPVQVILPEINLAFEISDISSIKASIQENEIKRLLDEKAWDSFDLEKGALWRFVVIKKSDDECILLFCIHHIISDAWSNSIFVNEFFAIYQAIINNEPLRLMPLPIQFADYSAWQHERFNKKEVKEPLLKYWRERLSNPTTLEIYEDYPRPSRQGFDGRSKKILFSNELTSQMKQFCIDKDVTMFMLLFTTFNTLLYRYTRQEDIMMGTVVANRNQPELFNVIGFVMNTLICRTNVVGDTSFNELLNQVKKNTIEMYEKQELPFDMLLEELKPERDLSRTPLFQVMYIHQSANNAELSVPGLEIKQLEIENKIAPFDLRLVSEETEGGICCRMDYSTALYKDETIERMLSHFKALLEGILENPCCNINRLPLLSQNEFNQVVHKFNETKVNYPTDKKVYELFEEQAEKTPEATALVFKGEQLTYEELNCKANQLAHYLKGEGVGPNVTVGICLERSFDMVISILGILKAGGAYVPFDPDYPLDRMAYMINNADVRVVLTWEELLAKIPKEQGNVLCIDKLEAEINKESKENLPCEVNDDDLAYIIYTSGSTGMPKGAMNTHKGIRNHKLWMKDVYDIKAEDRFLQKTPFSFDVSVWEFFLPLICGATLVVAKPQGHRDPFYLEKTIIEEKITVIHFVPSMLQAFLENADIKACKGLKQVFSSGEALTIGLQKRFYEHFNVPLHNVYGPAECSDVSTAWTCDNNYSDRILPIGKPISNVRVYILDNELQPVPVGVPGEIFVAGISVGKGYINNEELTESRFISDPFSNEIGSKMYKTGDLARYLPDGNIQYIGRTDFQVKIRGLRIELEEIEKALLEHEDIKESVVIAWDKDKGDKHLVGYLVTHSKLELNNSELFEHLKNKLPEYMIPRVFVFLDALPLSHNGKLDRKALPKPELSNSNKNEYVAPRNKIQEDIVVAIQQVLNTDSFGMYDDFFERGGDSLKAVKLIQLLPYYEFGLMDLFAHPTPERLSKNIMKREKEAKYIPLKEVQLPEYMRASLKRLYFYESNGELNDFLISLECIQQMVYLFIRETYGDSMSFKGYFAENLSISLTIDKDDNILELHTDVMNTLYNIPGVNHKVYEGEGTAEESLAKLEKLLDKGCFVFAMPAMQRVPFFNSFVSFDVSLENLQLSHAFLVIGHDEKRLFYVESPLAVNASYVHLEGNRGIGVIDKKDMLPSFELVRFVELYAEPINNIDSIAVAKNVMKESINCYYKPLEINKDNNKVLYGIDVIDYFIYLCDKENIRLDGNLKSYELMSLKYYFHWKMNVIALTRNIMIYALEEIAQESGQDISSLINSVRECKNEWKNINLYMNSRYLNKEFVLDKKYKRIFERIKEKELLMIEELKKFLGLDNH